MSLQTRDFFQASPALFTGEQPSASGAANLIENCLGDVSNKTVLVVCEDPKYGWYDAAAPATVSEELRARGARVKQLIVGPPQNQPNAVVQTAMNHADSVVFFARLGDQGRFNWNYKGPTCVMSYALNKTMLDGGYGRLDHHAMQMMKIAIDEVTISACHIKVTCPNGTNFEGTTIAPSAHRGEVIINRFPLGISQPILNDGFCGKAVLTNYLTPTGSLTYNPEYLAIDTPVTAHFEGNRITGFTGAPDMVAAVEAHYADVADRFGLDAYNIDSWHAGFHPLMAYEGSATADPLRWSGTAFQHQRILHFHTCGTGPPGEICWMILDPTVLIDGVALWENGKLHPERFETTGRVLDAFPELAAAFAAPAAPCGIDR